MTTRDSAPAASAVNWEAYSHEELHQMLWQDADVADVSTVAIEWTQHRAALDTHADVLREQRAALLDSWQGPAAEEAANRLDALATRVEKISELARAGQQAAQDAADALAMARAMMPPPPTDPAAPFTGIPGTWGQASGAPPLPAMPANPFASYSAIPSFAPAQPSPGMNNAVGSGGFSFYFGAGAMDQQKAQAVRAMQTYESSLAGSGRMIDQARGAIPPASTTTSTSGIPAGPAGGGSGVPWARLTRGGGAGSVGAFRGGMSMGMGMGMSPVIGSPPGASPSAPLGAGPRVGALPGVPSGVGTPAGQLAAQSAAARGAGPGGLMSPVGAQRGGDDEPYENRLPRIDHGLFTIDTPTSPAVIGETPIGAQQ